MPGESGWRLLALGALDLLLGGLVGLVDLGGAHELGDGPGVVAALPENAAAINVLRSGEKAHAVEVRNIAEVGGLLLVGLAVIFVGGVVVFADLGGLAALVPGGGGLGVRDGGAEGGQREQQESKGKAVERRAE